MRVKEKIKSFFTSNIKAKLICLCLAFMLWVFVSSNQSLLGKFPNQIPVKIINLSQNYSAFLDQDNVQIYLMAESAIWKSLQSESFTANVDVNGLSEGTYELEVKVSSSVSGVQITKIEPSKIFVNIEKVESKKVLVNAKIDGDPADGMAVGQIEIVPQEVEITGPSSYIEAVSESQISLQLNGESSSFERNCEVYAIAENNSKLSGIKFNPEKVAVKVPITRGGNNKTVGIKVKTKNSPAEGYYVSSITSSPNVLDITGQRSILTNINYLETEEIDLQNAQNKISKQVAVLLPDGVSLQKGAPSKVSVEINIAQMQISKMVIPEYIENGIGTGLKIASITPNDIKITVTGASEILSTVNTDNVKLNLDLSGKSIGTHIIDLNSSMITIPAGVSISSILPNSITVTITD